MKTVAIFAGERADPLRVQSRLMSLLTCGGWRIVIPDQPCLIAYQIVETCLSLKRDVLVVGTTARSKCGAPPRCYQKIKTMSRFWLEGEWQRDDYIIQLADCVECHGADLGQRVPLYKQGGWMSAIRLIDPPALGHVDYKTAMIRGLGALLVEKLLV